MAALTAVTPAGKRYPQRMGTFDTFLGTITGPASYTTGGDTLAAKLLGMNAIEGGLVQTFNNHVYRLILQADGSVKVQVFVTSTGVEVANATNLSAESPFAIIIGH